MLFDERNRRRVFTWRSGHGGSNPLKPEPEPLPEEIVEAKEALRRAESEY